MPPSIPVYLALGSNLGNRAAHIHRALDALAELGGVEETAFLYETPPAYVTDQPAFLNTACRLRTALSPLDLLAGLKAIEQTLGRRPTVRYGPRVIDLDILFYADQVVDEPALQIPHPGIPERAFVLAPLMDLAPDLYHPRLGRSVRELWQALGAERPPRVMPVGDRLWTWDARTYVMGILNVTPDSFSGDGILAGEGDPVAAAVARARQMAAEGADVLDVGGYSTRPGHDPISEDEEIRRVVPVIRALHDALDLPISVDTFRSRVAQAALEAGACWINDVWGLRVDPALGALAARRKTPLVLMHNRTQPPGPDRLPHLQRGYAYTHVAQEVRDELTQIVELAREAGVPRWLRMVDPGIGFGKRPEQHLALIRDLVVVKELDYPLLFGASRKGFIGRILGDLPPQERVEGTLALNVLAVERGADLVRVHDVRPNVRAVRMADAVVRDLR